MLKDAVEHLPDGHRWDKHSIIFFYEKYTKTVNQSVFSNAASSSAFLSVFQHRVSMRQ